MASPDSTKIRIAGTGAIWKAPVGSTAPTDSTTALAAAWLNLGYMQDGFEVNQELKTKDIEVWQSLEVVRQIATGLSRTINFEAIESNNQTVALAWNNATITPGTGGAYTMTIPSSYLASEFALILDATDGTTSQRIYIPRATLNATPKITAGRQDAITYQFEIQVLQPTDGSNPVIVYGKDAGVAS
jgi:hypothetical protein